ncbi:hypothetical protein LJC04_04490 [Ruminococcaceae bacterium OttesenSCG-928-O06]|nr:hypothetical protein [Ruminococcaceae bacterium OttesenSCG-928-O06]
MASYGCGKGCGVDMEYIDNGDWECPSCGIVIPFGVPNEDDTSTGESLSVWDAAEIYLSNGCDDDYCFGYSHEDLMRASGNL